MFGHGLGDVIYFFGICFFAFVLLFLNLYFRKDKFQKKRQRIYLTIAIVFLVISILFTYKFTIGRGIENKWNGSVFILIRN